MYILIWVFMISVAGLLCGLVYNRYKKLVAIKTEFEQIKNLTKEQENEYKFINQQIYELHQTLAWLTQEINDKTKRKEVLENKNQELQTNLELLNVTIKEREENFEKTAKLMWSAQEKRLEEESKLKLTLLEKNEQEQIQNLKKYYEEQQLIMLHEIDLVSEELKELKNKRDAIIAEQKRQEELEKQLSFHQLNLTEQELSDIQILNSYIAALYNKTAISKLIWSTYYQPKYKLLVGRVVGSNKISGIYRITNIKNKKSYIGQSTDIGARWGAHLKTSLGLDGCSHSRIHDAIREEGVENFTFEILEKCDKSELNNREKYYISFYETNSYGYNSTKGGS